MTHGSLFSGIGGFDLAAEWMGWENKFHCEWNPFCQKILKQHFPNSESFSNIKETDFKKYANRIDILTGGFPCQPYSVAGKRKGKEDDRHLWPEMLRAIGEIKPRWIVGENVSGLLNWNGGLVLDEIKTSLEAKGYKVFAPLHIGAASVNAPHKRMRVWIIANLNESSNIGESGENESESEKERLQERNEIQQSFKSNSVREVLTDINNTGIQRREASGNIKTERAVCEQFTRGYYQRNDWRVFPTQSPICGGVHGISNRVDRIKALGNAIVPQVAFEIFKAIEQYEILTTN